MVQDKKGKRCLEVFKTSACLLTSVLATQAHINLSLRHLTFCVFHPTKNEQINLKLPPPRGGYKHLLIKYKNKLWILTMQRIGINAPCLNFTYQPPGITAINFFCKKWLRWNHCHVHQRSYRMVINTTFHLEAHAKCCQKNLIFAFNYLIKSLLLMMS